jgi:hypothetical protein
MLVFLAVLTGTIVGSLSDPIFLVGLVAALIMGARGPSLGYTAAAVVIFAAIRLAVSYQNRSAHGLDPLNLFVPLGTAIAFILVYLIAAGLRRAMLALHR